LAGGADSSGAVNQVVYDREERSFMNAIRDLATLLDSLDPCLEAGEYVFCHVDGLVPDGVAPIATFREEEGLSLILERSVADRVGFAYESSFARITLKVHSSLDAVGLTAAVATALAEAGIAANVVAAFHHDHLFVPNEKGGAALAILKGLQRKLPGDRG